METMDWVEIEKSGYPPEKERSGEYDNTMVYSILFTDGTDVLAGTYSNKVFYDERDGEPTSIIVTHWTNFPDPPSK